MATILESQSLPGPQSVRERRSSQRTWLKRCVIAIGVVGVVASAAVFIPGASSAKALDPALTHTIKRGLLLVTVTEQGTLESSNNTEVKCRVRGNSVITWVVESGTKVNQGDDLVKLETLLIDEEISERTKYAHLARSAVARSKANVERAELAISEYVEGRYIAALSNLQKDLAIAQSRLLSTKNRLDYTRMMSKSGYTSKLKVEEREFAVTKADLDVKLTETEIAVLNDFTKQEQLATLTGNLKAAKATYEADKERAFADEKRLERAQWEFQQCSITAERSGTVIYPTGEEWKDAPEIEEGATVHRDQVLLLMPDLTQMQVKVGIHESIVDRVKPGLLARVTLSGKVLEGEVDTVAPVAKPAGWWTGNVVKYDTIVQLPSVKGLKPGMSVEVEVIIARHENVLMIPTSAVMQTGKGHVCWIHNGGKTERRALKLGDGSDMFIVVVDGLNEGDQVVLDPLANIEEAQTEAAALHETAFRKRQKGKL